MKTSVLEDTVATVRLNESEVMLLCVMAQFWVEELRSDAPLALELSEKLRELACRLDVH